MAANLQPLLLEALASRASSAPDSALQAALSADTASQTGAALPTLQELLNQLETTNPTLGLIAKYLTALRTAESESVIEMEPEPELETRQTQDALLLAQAVERLKGQINNLRAELHQLRERNDTLATALGACYLCWGEDADCPVCRGSGRPGSGFLDNDSFRQWVAPTLKRMHAAKEVTPPISDTRHSNGSQDQVKTLKGEHNE